MALQLLRAIDSSVAKDPYEDAPRTSPHPSPKHRRRSASYLSTAASPRSQLGRYFVQPMDLCEPNEDVLGFTQVCSLRLEEIQDLKRSKLNSPVRVGDGRLVPSFSVRLWSRASGRYVQILQVGAMPYARGVFGPRGAFQMLVLDERENIVLFQSSTNPQFHLGVKRTSITGMGTGDAHSMFRLLQNEDGYIVLESFAQPGHYLGVRNNGNVMLTDTVDPNSVHAQFILQKEAMDLI